MLLLDAIKIKMVKQFKTSVKMAIIVLIHPSTLFLARLVLLDLFLQIILVVKVFNAKI